MTTQPPSGRPRPSLLARLRRAWRRFWLDRLPIAGWYAAWREERRLKAAAARRPRPVQLRPEFDIIEDRSFMGLTFGGAVQVALVGTGVVILGEALRQAFAHGSPTPAPATPPGTADPANAAPLSDVTARSEPLMSTVPVVFTAAGDWGNGLAGSADALEELGSPLNSAGPLSTLKGLDADPGQSDPSSGSDEPKGGGGGTPSPPAAGDPAGGGAAAPSPSPFGGGASAPAPLATPGGNAASFVPPAQQPAGHSLTTSGAAPTLVAPVSFAGAAAGTHAPAVTPTAPDATNIAQAYGHPPLAFEANLGQTDSAVQYLSHGPGFQIFLTGDGAATFALTRPGQDPAAPTVTRDVLRLSLVGANPAPRIVPEGQLPSYANYFSGGTSPSALTNVSQYSELVEKNIYPGIDLVWHSAPGSRDLEYDFVVAPGADPSAIHLHLDGTSSLSNDAQGELLIHTGGGTLVQRAPVVTQPGATAAAGPQAVSGSALLRPDGDLAFQLGRYDTTKALTIDPVIQYSSYLGGSGDDRAYAVAADGSGDLYAAGITTSTNFPTTTGAYQTSNPSTQALFITKLNAAGTAYVYSTYLSGPSITSPSNLYGLAVDATGAAYFTGTTSASNFPVTAGAYRTTLYGTTDAFLTKLNVTGDALLYSTYFGTDGTTGAAVAVDPYGSAYLTGSTPATAGGHPFPTAGSPFQSSAGAGTHAFLSKFNATGTGLAYSTFLAGSGTDNGYGIAVDTQGDAYVTGATTSSNFPTTASAYQTGYGGGGNSVAFVSKLNPSGSALSYSTYLGGSGGDQGNAIALDPSGNAYVTGSTSSTNFPTTASAYKTSAGGMGDAFVTKLNGAGTGLTFSTYLGGSAADSGAGIAVDTSGNAVVTGYTKSAGMMGVGAFPTTSGALQSSFGSGTQDAFITRLAANGQSLSYSTFLGGTGGSGTSAGSGAAVDDLGNAYADGYTSATNFPTVSALQGSNGGGTFDAWVAKLSPLPSAPVFTSVTGGVSTSAGQVTSSQNLTLSGTSAASATVTVSRADLGVLGTATADGSGNWSYTYSTTLAAGTYSFTATQTSGGVTSNPTSAYVVTVETAGPTVTLTAPASTNTLAPVVRVTASDQNGMPDGTTVTIDADKNNDGNFTDAGESGYATGTLTGGTVAITLPAFSGTGTYPLRARVTNPAGNQTTSATSTVVISSATTWSMTAQVLTVDPQAGDAIDQLGDVRQSVPLNLDLSGGTKAAPAMDCGCSANKSALVYHSDSVSQQPVMQATIQSPNNAALPASVSAKLTWNGTPGATLTYSTSGLNKGDALVIAVQVPSAVTTTGAYSWSLAVSASGNNLSASGTTYVVAQDSSVFGAGWTFGPLDQITSVSGGVLMAFGTGGWGYYASSGGGSFTSPAGDNGTLSQSGGTYTYSTPDGQTWTFNSSGYETGWTSPDGQSLVTFTYSGGNLATMSASDGTTTTFNYASGKVSTIVTGDSRTTTLAYSGSNLTQVTNPDGGVETFTYDANHRLTGETFANLQDAWAYGSSGALGTMTWGSSGSPSVSTYLPAMAQGLSAAVLGPVQAQQTDPVGNVTKLQLDGQGRPLQETAANGGVTTWKRDGNGYVTSTTDPLSRTTTFALDAAGYVTQMTLPDGNTQVSAYQASYPTAFHALTTFTDERNNTTTHGYDASGHPTRTTDPLGDVTTAAYNAAGERTGVTDPRGDRTTFAYDTLRRLTKITDAAGGVTTLAYDANGYQQTTTDQLGRVSTALFDVMGRQTGTIDAAGDRTTVTYNAAGLALTSTDALGRQTSTIYDSYNRGLVAQAINAVGTAAQSDTLTSYDADGRVSQSRNADGWVGTYAYDPTGHPSQGNDALAGASPAVYDLAGQQTASRNAVGQWGNSAYNLRGMVTQSTDALGNVNTVAYDAAGHQTSTTDPLSHTATTLYDAAGRATTSIDALGHRVTTTYDAAGNVSTVTDALGTVGSYAYDLLNRRTMTTEAVGTSLQRTSTVAYDAAGNVTSTTDALGHVLTYAYDALNRQTAATDALNHTVTSTFDAAGNLSTTKDALGDVTTYQYDALNNQTAVTDPLGHTVTTLYDAAGHAVESIDAVGDVSHSDYNAVGEVAASVDALGKVTQYGYDAAGHRVSLTDPDGNTTKWVYDGDGRQVNQIDPFSGVVTTAYDSAGRKTSVTDQFGRAMTYAYDAANRLTGSTWKAAGGSTTNVQTLTYDANNNQLTAADYSGTYTNSYDVLNRLTAQTGPFGVALTYMYDAGDRQTTVQDSLSGVTTSVYDNANRLTTREFGGSGQTPLRIDPNYDAANRLTGLTRYSNLNGSTVVATTSFSYDAASRVTAIVSKDSTPATISYYNYQYDAANRATVQSGTGATGTYTYDAASQVTNDGNTTYSYDANGNRTMAGYQTGTGNQTTNDGTWTYTYDAAGNLTQKSNSSATWSYGYDNENHLTTIKETVSGSTALQVTYTYDVYGQRIEQQEWQSGTGTVTTEFVWSNGQVVMDLNGSNAVQERYLWGTAVDELFARIDSNGAWWYITDELGSVRDVLNASGVSQDHTDYTAYGAVISQTSASAQGRYGWTGREYDAQTGLQYNRARYYNPATGTWVSQDPIGFAAGDANLYRYVGNRPVNANDPLGLASAVVDGKWFWQGALDANGWGKLAAPATWDTKGLITWFSKIAANVFGTPGDVLVYLTLTYLKTQISSFIVLLEDDGETPCKFKDSKPIVKIQGSPKGSYGAKVPGASLLAWLTALGFTSFDLISYEVKPEVAIDTRDPKATPPTVTLLLSVSVDAKMLGIQKEYDRNLGVTLTCGVANKPWPPGLGAGGGAWDKGGDPPANPRKP